jgi:inner membrane protein
MDPIAHSLLGAALGRTRLARATPLALPTAVLAANTPDVDVVAYFWSSDAALAFRRGLTHGPLGLALLPALAVVLVVGLARWRRGAAPASTAWRPLLAIAYVAALTHPVLDWLNTYGVRFLHPFDRRWFYGDTLFIVDPWVWLVLAATLAWSRRARRRGVAAGERAATAGIAVFALYAAVLAGGARVASAEVRAAVAGPVERMMVGPLPLTPARREVVVASPVEIRYGRYRWLKSPRLEWTKWTRPRPQPSTLLDTALADPSIQGFLGWARFLFVEIDEHPAFWEVHLMDARYTLERAAPFGSAMVRVPRP